MASVSKSIKHKLQIRFTQSCLNHFSVPEEPDEDAKPKTAPTFVSKPESVQVEEGEWARFQARVTGHPRPRVMWLINGHTVVNVSEEKINLLFRLHAQYTSLPIYYHYPSKKRIKSIK